MTAPRESLTFIDLFCGCGGFSLGLQRAGLRCLAAIDFDEKAVTTYRANFPKETVVLKRDLTRFTPAKLAAKLGSNTVDVIVGGPPCQGFSNARQNKAANHGRRVRKDKRRWLYRPFLDYVAAFRPRVFVIENVLGIQSAAKGKYFTAVQGDARRLGYRVQAQVEEAWKLGVPQSRRRQLFIGVRDDVSGYFPGELRPSRRVQKHAEVTLWDAIGDLPAVPAGGGEEERDYDLDGRVAHHLARGEGGRHYVEEVLDVGRANKLTAHRARPHNEFDLRDFARLREGEHSGQAEARGEKMEFPYKRTCFEDRYKRQHRERVCSTIVAHLSKDGLGFIHPTQNRSLTPREAARVQSFPDWFRFPVTRTHQFRLIGNAVPPLVGEAVGEEVAAFLCGEQVEDDSATRNPTPLPRNEDEAVERLRPLLDLPETALRRIDAELFKRAWFSIAFLYAGLHPDSALDHGDTITRESEQEYGSVSRLEPRLLAPYYVRSGWPVVLAPIAREAWRRFRRGKLKDYEFYSCEAQQAGISHRAPGLQGNIVNGRADLRREVQTEMRLDPHWRN